MFQIKKVKLTFKSLRRGIIISVLFYGGVIFLSWKELYLKLCPMKILLLTKEIYDVIKFVFYKVVLCT